MKNKKININLNDDGRVSAALRSKNNAEIRKKWKMLKNMNCRLCGYNCTNVCESIQKQIRVLQLENSGGKSDFLFDVDVSESPQTVPVEIYLQLLQAFADLKRDAPAPAAILPQKHAEKPENEEKDAAKTTSKPFSKGKPYNSPAKTAKILPISDEGNERDESGQTPDQITPLEELSAGNPFPGILDEKE